MEEIWKDIGLQTKQARYQVSNLGNMRKIHLINGIDAWTRSLKTHIRERSIHSSEVYICLRRENGKSYSYRIHTLVAKLFVPNPNGYIFVQHIDGDFRNNRADNLMWVGSSSDMVARKMKMYRETKEAYFKEQLNLFKESDMQGDVDTIARYFFEQGYYYRRKSPNASKKC